MRLQKFTNPSQLEGRWSEKAKMNLVGLYNEQSTIVNIPLNVVFKRTVQMYNTSYTLQRYILYKELKKRDYRKNKCGFMQL